LNYLPAATASSRLQLFVSQSFSFDYVNSELIPFLKVVKVLQSY
jgi:hypothetical protein